MKEGEGTKKDTPVNSDNPFSDYRKVSGSLTFGNSSRLF